MITRVHQVLIGALIAQVVLVFVVYLRSGDDGPAGEHALIAGFDPASATAVQVFGDGHAKPDVDLAKRGADWVLASHWSYPAETSKVTDALAPLGKMMVTDPIATSPAYHKQLRVADDDFDRKLVVTTGDGKTQTIFIGGSAGIRRTAVRLGGDNNVYGVTGISTFSFNVAARDWVKRDYYELAKDQIDKLVVERGAQKIEIERVVPPAPPAGAGSGSGSAAGSGSGSATPPAPSQETEWRVTIDGAPLVPAAPEELDTLRIGDLLAEVGTIPAIPADPEHAADKPVATITVHKKTGSDDHLVIVADGDQYWVKRDGLDRATLVPKVELDKLVTVARENLVKKPDATKPDAPAEPPPGLPPGLPPDFDLPEP